MAISSETYNKDLYSLLKTKGYRPIPLDFKGEKTDPEQAVVFEFQFKKDGEKYGVSYVTVDNDVTVYYDEEQIDSPSTPSKDLDYDDTWTGFLKQLKQWAMNKQLGFDLQNKDRLGDDLAQRKYTMDKEKINEGYYPMGKTASYNDAVPTVKIILQHTRQIQEGEQRFRNVAKIFLENQLGERILAPTTRPGIAQVYARHLAEGGVPNDERWNHIKGLCEEYSKMAGFVRAVKNHQFNESAQQLVSEGVNHYTNLRETLSRMRGQRGYNTYFESWTPTLMEDESSDNTLNELFVQETLDPRIESVLPILSKLRKSVAEMKEVDELAEWADNLTEAPGAMTLKHNQDTGKSNLKAFDLEEDDVQDELTKAQLARKKMKLPPSMRDPLSLGDIEASKKHPSSSGVVGRLADEPKKTTEEKDVEDTDLVMKLSQLTKAPDMFDAIYDALTSDDELGQHLQDMYFDIAREHRFHLDDDFEDIILKMADQLEHYYGEQGVAEGAPELLKQEMPLVRHIERELEQHGYEKGTPEYNEQFKHAIAMYRKFGNIDAIRKGVAEADMLQGTPVVSLKDFGDKDYKKDKYGRIVPKKLKKDDPRVKFHKDQRQGVAEGSEQTNESLDRLLYLANIETSKKKVDESIDDMFSLGGELPRIHSIPQDSTAAQAQQQAMVDRMKQRTIDKILDIKPEWGRSDLELMTAAELNQILRDLQSVAEGDDDLVDLEPALRDLTGEFNKFMKHDDRMETDPAYAKKWNKRYAKYAGNNDHDIYDDPEDYEQGVREGFFGNMANKLKSAFSRQPTNFDATGKYPDGSSLRTPGVDEWKKQFQQAVMAVKNAKTQQEYEAASDRAGRIKELLASRGVQVGPILGAQGVAEGLNEMDKSAPQPGRDGRVSHSTYGSRDKKGSDYFQGKEAPGKPITAKQASKYALGILKKQGVGEGEFAGHYKTGPKGQLGPTEKAKNISPVIGQQEKQHPFHGKLVGNESVEYDLLNDIKRLLK